MQEISHHLLTMKTIKEHNYCGSEFHLSLVQLSAMA